MRNNIFWSYVILWLILNSFSLYLQTWQAHDFANELSFKQGKKFFDQIVSMRNWNAIHGGVYVPVTETTQPNPLLKTPYRDITRADGLQLTLVNPFNITHQLSEIDHKQTGIKFHITSLTPIRAENKADPWENIALQSFKSGKKKAYAISNIDGEPFYRYMEPLYIESTCLQCHIHQDEKEADIFGGISVSIPTDSITADIEDHTLHLIIIHGIIFLSGLALLILHKITGWKLSQRLEQVKEKINLSYIDSLTNLPNRRQCELFLRKEWKRAMRQQYPLSLIMIDIDLFKAFNSTLGRPEGDQCLKKIAATLQQHFRRPDDLIARYGGDEFCIVACCNAEQIKLLAESLKNAVEDSKIKHPDSKISAFVTISLGVTTLIPNDENKPIQLLRFADRALYSAKGNGRNRVEQYQN